MEKKVRKIVKFENLTPELLIQINKKYPEGYDEHIIKINGPNNTIFYAFMLDLPDASYLIKVNVKIDNSEYGDDDDEENEERIGREDDSFGNDTDEDEDEIIEKKKLERRKTEEAEEDDFDDEEELYNADEDEDKEEKMPKAKNDNSAAKSNKIEIAPKKKGKK